MGDIEWLSKEAVTPFSSIKCESALHSMLKYEVQVYFVIKKLYNEIMSAKDYRLKILNSLESGNQKQGINIRPLLPNYE